MSSGEKQLSDHCRRLVEQWFANGKDLRRFTEHEQELLALYLFNLDYGGNGMPEYVSWQGHSTLEPLLRGLTRIGADRLCTIVREYFAFLDLHGFDPEKVNVYEFIEGCPQAVQDEFDSRQSEAADLYSDFFVRWEATYSQLLGNIRPL